MYYTNLETSETVTFVKVYHVVYKLLSISIGRYEDLFTR